MLALPMNAPAPHLRSSIQDASGPTASSICSYHTSTSDPESLTSSQAMLSSLQSPSSSSNKRPKLSLQTGGLPIAFGKSTTALAINLSAASTASPTALNTFNNAYDVPHRSSPSNTSPSGWKQNKPASRLVSPYVSHHREDQPYQLPRGIRGILRNSPFPSSLRRSSVANSAGSATRRMFFPAPKRVTYRAPLEEEIRTAKFIARHSDLSSDESEGETQWDGSEDSDGSNHSDSISGEEAEVERSKTRRKRKNSGGHSERQVRAAAIRDGLTDEEEFEPSTPAHTSQRKRRRREWKWTLGPLDEDCIAPDSTLNNTMGKPPEPGEGTSDADGQAPPSDINNHASVSPSQIPLPATPVD